MRLTHIVFYTTPKSDGKTEEGVEAFYDDNEAARFVQDILKDPGTQVQHITAFKESIVALATPGEGSVLASYRG